MPVGNKSRTNRTSSSRRFPAERNVWTPGTSRNRRSSHHDLVETKRTLSTGSSVNTRSGSFGLAPFMSSQNSVDGWAAATTDPN